MLIFLSTYKIGKTKNIEEKREFLGKDSFFTKSGHAAFFTKY